MFLAEFLGVTGLSVGYIGLTGLGIVDDMGPQNCDLRHAFLCRLDPRRQFIVVGRGRRCFFLQYRIFQQVMLGEIIHGLRHLFQVKNLGPAHIPSAFSSLEFGLNIHQQIDLRRLCLHGRFLTGCMLLFAGENGQQVLQGVAFTQAVRAASAARPGWQVSVPGHCQWQPAAAPGGRAWPDRPAICYSSFHGALDFRQ